MRGVRGDIAEKRTILVGFDELHRTVKPYIGAIAGKLLRLAIVKVRIVEIIIAPIVGSLADASPAVNEHLAESSILRPERVVVPQMPLAENTGSIAAGRENITHCDFVFPQERSAHDGMPDARSIAVMSRHQSRPGGRTGRAYVKVR